MVFETYGRRFPITDDRGMGGMSLMLLPIGRDDSCGFDLGRDLSIRRIRVWGREMKVPRIHPWIATSGTTVAVVIMKLRAAGDVSFFLVLHITVTATR